MENILKELFINHSGKISDRWTLYINEWDKFFSPFRDREINLLEIGVHNGGSLEIWAKYFKKAKHIIGCDIDEACRDLKFDDPRISVVIGDVNDDEVKDRILEISPDLDVIIDDGSHESPDIIKSFANYFNQLTHDGIYLIEDLHASYWGEHENGLFNPYSAMTFLKRLVDLVNFEHWQNLQSRGEFLKPYEEHYDVHFDSFDFLQLHSITFVNSLCVIRKRPPEENALGKRIIAGSKELKPQNYHKLNGTSIHDLDKDLVDDSNLDIFSLIKQMDTLETHVEEQEKSVKQLKAEIIEQQGSIRQLNTDIAAREQFIKHLETDLNTREQFIKHLETDLNTREQSIQQLEADVEKRKQVNQGSRNLIVEQNRILEGLYDDLKERDLAIQQMQDKLDEDQQQINEYIQQAHTLNQKTLRLENEALFYVLSKSWRFTRPLRKLVGKFRGKQNV